MAVAALAGQMELEAAVLARGFIVSGEGDALIDQPLDGLAAVFYGETHGVFAAQTGTGVEGVGDV